MEHLKKYVIPSVLIAGSLAALFFFREIPAARLWKGYTVLYVPAGSDYAAVCDALDRSGCTEYISLKNQYFPIAAPADSPEVSLAMSGLEASSYLSAR
ncbi:MAG: hypothetical protein K2H09_07385, partial [Treponemataceae bacterium]|nr:hypothetical protein [Treponemataceae bacterium]